MDTVTLKCGHVMDFDAFISKCGQLVIKMDRYEMGPQSVSIRQPLEHDGDHDMTVTVADPDRDKLRGILSEGRYKCDVFGNAIAITIL